MELVGFGDTHFDKLDNLIPDATELICKSMERVFDYALENGVRNVLQYGDVCERPRLSYHAQVHLYKTLLKKKYRDINFHIILGNHDFAEDGTHSLQILEVFCQMMQRNVTVYTKPERVVLDGVSMNFLPYPHTSTTKNAINVGHFEVAGSLRDNGRKIEEGLASKHVTLMGHLHTKHRVRNTFYSGTLFQTNFGEALPKFFHHVTAESHHKEDVHVKNVPFEPPWKLLNLTVSSEKDLEEVVDDPRVLYKLFLKEGANVDLDRILDKHPNIVRHNSFKNKKELELMVQQSWEFDSDTCEEIVNIDEAGTVAELLKISGLKKAQVARGLDILGNITGKLKIKTK